MVEAASTRHPGFPSKPVRAEDDQATWVQLGHRTSFHGSQRALQGEPGVGS